jgi:hypothetical protein
MCAAGMLLRIHRGDAAYTIQSEEGSSEDEGA